ncbi:MAG: YibE/F family protein [Agathobacter sp.]|nr:YibE/F family protein [Agathobacter sp.]
MEVKKHINSKKIIILMALMIGFVFLLIKCNHIEKVSLISTEGQSYEKAVVTKITKDNLAEDGNRYGNQELEVEIKSGSLKGENLEAINPNGTLFGAECEVGTSVIVIVSSSEDTNVVTVYSKDRTNAIYMFILIFTAIVCIIGGKKGIKAILSLAFTFVCIVYIMFPLVYKGNSPVLITILICVVTTIVTIGMLGGVSKKTVSAIIGTTFGVVISGISALAFGEFAGITGYNVSDIETLNYVAQNTSIKIGQLLFSGIIIASLGAVMDVGMSISSTICEIKETNPGMQAKQLFISGIHVGRDMMGTMTNTLILAFVGSSLSSLMTNYAYDLSYNQLINSYSIGIEIMQGLSGSLGVVLTVPFTAAISSLLITGKRKEK